MKNRTNVFNAELRVNEFGGFNPIRGFNPELRVNPNGGFNPIEGFNPDKFIERERINKRFINLLSYFGRVEFKYEGRTVRYDDGDVAVRDALYFSRGANSLEIRIRTLNNESMKIRYSHIIFETDNSDVELLDAIRDIVYTLDEMNRVKSEEECSEVADKRDILKFFIDELEKVDTVDTHSIYRLCDKFLYYMPELREEKELINKLSKLFMARIGKSIK